MLWISVGLSIQELKAFVSLIGIGAVIGLAVGTVAGLILSAIAASMRAQIGHVAAPVGKMTFVAVPVVSVPTVIATTATSSSP